MQNVLFDSNRDKCIPKFATIDSYSIIVDQTELLEIDYKFFEVPTMMYNSTGEYFDDILTLQPQSHKKNGITLRFSRMSIPSNKSFKGGDFIRFVITSKMLRTNYFEGLSYSNLDTVVDYINGTGLVKLNRDILLKSIFNDLDICKNFYANDEFYSSRLENLYSIVKDTCKNDVNLFKDKKDKDNKGLIFGHDRKQGHYRKPFIKFYNKANELYTKSVEFYKVYLQSFVLNGQLDIKDLRRFETTVKNSYHKKMIVQSSETSIKEFRTLKDLYDCPPAQLNEIMLLGLKHYFEKKPPYIKGLNMSPVDNALSYFIDVIIKQGGSIDTVFDVLETTDNKDQKYKLKKRITRCYDYVVGSDYMEKLIDKNADFDSFLRYLELDFIIPQVNKRSNK